MCLLLLAEIPAAWAVPVQQCQCGIRRKHCSYTLGEFHLGANASPVSLQRCQPLLFKEFGVFPLQGRAGSRGREVLLGKGLEQKVCLWLQVPAGHCSSAVTRAGGSEVGVPAFPQPGTALHGFPVSS